MIALALLTAQLALGAFPPPVQGGGALEGEGAGYSVVLLTMDQGDEVWERFGHNALLIRDEASGATLAWNWGLFDFGAVDFIPRFLRGTMLYTMGPAEPDPFFASYVQANRTVYANEIYLDPEEAAALAAFVRWNFEPRNRDYVYHYYLDNCSTRVRDALDGVLGGIMKDRFEGVSTGRSFRWFSRRLVQETGWIDQGLSFLLGARGDRPVSEWASMFVPMEMMELLEGFERPDGLGGTRPLLGPRRTLFQASRPPTPPLPPRFSPLWLVLGAGIAGVGLVLGHAARRGGRLPRGALFLFLTGWGVFSGALGGILLLAWFTDHDFIQWNLNLFHLSPLALLLPLAALPLLLRAGPGGERPAPAGGGQASTAGRLAALIALASVAVALLQATPLLTQGNGEVLAVALPVNLAVAWALNRLPSTSPGR